MNRRTKLLIFLVPAVAGLLLFLANISAWRNTETLIIRLGRNQSETMAREIGLRLSNLLEERTNDLALLAFLWRQTPPPARHEEFMAHAEAIVEHEPSYHVINYVSPESVIELSAPKGKRPELIGLDLTTLPEREYLHQQVREGRRPMASPAMILTTDRPGMVIWHPVFSEPGETGDFLGMIAGTMHLDAVLEQVITETGSNEYIITLKINGHAVYSIEPAHPDARRADRQMRGTSALELLSRRLEIEVIPVPKGRVDRLLQNNMRKLGINLTVSGLAVLMLFITFWSLERQRASRRKIREQQERLQLAIQGAELGTWDLDVSTGHVVYNRRWAEMLGYELEELKPTPETWVNLLHPDERDQLLDALKEHMEGKTPFYMCDHRLKTKSGAWKWVQTIGKVLVRDENGAPLRATGIHIDIDQRKRTEERIKASEARFRRLVENAADAFFLADIDGRIMDVNDVACASLGYSRDELLNMRVSDIEVTQDQAKWNSLWRDGEARVRFMQGVHRRKDGSTINVEINACTFEENGRRYILGLARDVTERIEAQNALRESEERYRAIFENAPLGIFRSTPQGRYLTVNREFARTAGFADPQEMIRKVKNISDLYVDPARRREIKRLFAEHGKLTGHEIHIKRKDGGNAWITVYARAVRDDQGDIAYYDGFTLDVTDRKTAEQARETSEDMFWKIFSASPAAVTITGLEDGTVYEANEAFLNSMKYTRDEVIGKSAAQLGNWTDIAERERFVQTLRDQGEVMNYEADFRRKDGSLLTGMTSAKLVDIGGETFVLAITHDISLRKQMEKQLVRAKNAAESASRAKSEFLATMSHEIRTPLHGAMSMLQLLKTTKLDPEQDEYIEMALDSSRRLLRILSDILDLSQVEIGVIEVLEEDFSIQDVIQPVWGSFKDEAAQKGVSLNVEAYPDVPEHLLGDSLRIRQVLFNLVGNAVKYTEKGKVRVEIYTLPEGADSQSLNLHLAVCDTGAGIPDDQVERVFEMFTQADGSYSRKHPGAGLGLTIVKRLVLLMGGSMCIDSDPERGTQVHVTLRLKRSVSKKQAPAIHAEPKPAAKAKKKILVAEDENVNLLALVRYLQKLGYFVKGVTNGQEVLSSLKQEHFDCVILDVQMPVMDGVQTVENIRKNTSGDFDPGIPVVALTAHAMKEDREKLIARGMDDYVPKPMDMQNLTDVLARLMK